MSAFVSEAAVEQVRRDIQECAQPMNLVGKSAEELQALADRLNPDKNAVIRKFLTPAFLEPQQARSTAQQAIGIGLLILTASLITPVCVFLIGSTAVGVIAGIACTAGIFTIIESDAQRDIGEERQKELTEATQRINNQYCAFKASEKAHKEELSLFQTKLDLATAKFANDPAALKELFGVSAAAAPNEEKPAQASNTPAPAVAAIRKA